MRAHLFVDVPLATTTGLIAAGTGVWWPLAGATALASALHTWGVLSPRSSYYMPVCWRLPAATPHLALTFDDGPHPETTPAVLDLLARFDQRATFFVIGEHVRRHPELVRRARAAGHAIGLHSHSHSRWFHCWTPGRVVRDLEACAAAIADATGEPAPRLFRPPFGLKNPLVGEAARRLGLTTVTWTTRAWDTGRRPPAVIASRLAAAARPRAILMLHDGHEPAHRADRAGSVEALAQLLPILAERGLASRAIVAAERGIAVAE